MLDKVRRRADEFDMIHFHIDYLHFPLFRERAARTVTTLHGRLDLPDLPALYRAFPDMPLVSISYDQRRPMPPVRWAGTVYHGLPRDLYRLDAAAKRSYLAFLGRISPEKRPDRAIEIARRAGLPIKIAAKVDEADRDYYETYIRPLLNDPLVEFIGEIGEADKGPFLNGALALLFPIDWPEPFGLVMIEAMACGAPVIAWHHGSVPEIIEHGVTGAIVNSTDAAVAAIEEVAALDPVLIRRRFEARFTVERMARDYVRIYSAALDAAEERDTPFVLSSLPARSAAPPRPESNELAAVA